MEPVTIILKNNQNFDGTTLLSLRRDDFEVTENGRVLHKEIDGPAGLIGGDFFGLFSGGSAKLVGIAHSTANPKSTAQIVRLGPLPFVRAQFDLTPRLQYFVMLPGDYLAVDTKEFGWVLLTLVVNELGEKDHVQLAAAQATEPMWRRLRIIRRMPCVADVTAVPWRPTFTWDTGTNMLVAMDDGTGPIPVADLNLMPRSWSSFITVRYSNMEVGVGKLFLVEPTTRSKRELESGLTTVEWSKVHFVSHDDMLALECGGPSPNQVLVVDFEVVRVQPGDRLSRRYGNGL